MILNLEENEIKTICAALGYCFGHLNNQLMAKILGQVQYASQGFGERADTRADAPRVEAEVAQADRSNSFEQRKARPIQER
jgi:hypothetical protein